MFTGCLRKVGIALTVCGLILGMASAPAGASVHQGEILSGTFLFDLPDPFTEMEYDLADPVERPCIPGPPFPDPPTMDIDFASFPAGGTTEVTNIYFGSLFFDFGFFGSTHWYEVKFTLAPDPPYDNSGTISGSSMTQTLTVEMDMYDYGHNVELDDPEEECPWSDLACHAVMELNLSGTWIAMLQSAVLSGTGTVDALDGFCPDAAMEALFDGAIVDVDVLFIDF